MRPLALVLAGGAMVLASCGGGDLHEGAGGTEATTTLAPGETLPPAEAMTQYCRDVEAYAAAALENPDDPAVQQEGDRITAEGQALAERAALDPDSIDLAELQRCQAPLTQLVAPPEDG